MAVIGIGETDDKKMCDRKIATQARNIVPMVDSCPGLPEQKIELRLPLARVLAGHFSVIFLVLPFSYSYGRIFLVLPDLTAFLYLPNTNETGKKGTSPSRIHAIFARMAPGRAYLPRGIRRFRGGKKLLDAGKVVQQKARKTLLLSGMHGTLCPCGVRSLITAFFFRRPWIPGTPRSMGYPAEYRIPGLYIGNSDSISMGLLQASYASG